MAEKTFTVISEGGVHARPSTALVQAASTYASDVFIENKGKKVNLKSIMGVMSLGIAQGEDVTISASGADEDKAIAGIAKAMIEEEIGK